jgi:molecular chaperone GrpE
MGRSAKKKTDKNQQLEGQLKRALADYANLQKRVVGEREQLADYFKSILAFKFLPVLDSLEAAFKSVSKDGLDATKQGLELAVKEFKKVLESEGVKEITTNNGFDPAIHEAIEVIPGKEDNKIVEVVEKGYRLGDKILRPVKVKVEKKEEKGKN